MSHSTIPTRFDALVIGGGPAGATSAILLANAGWNVALIERSAFPRRKVCGEFVSAASFPLLFELGLAESFFALAGPEVRRVGLFAGEHSVVAPMPAVAGEFGAWGRALGREHLDVLSLEAAKRAGTHIIQPCTAVSVEPESKGWSCRLSGKGKDAQLQSVLVIAATGSWGKGKPFQPPQQSPAPADLFGFKAHFEACDLAPDLMPLLIFPGGYGGMVRSDSGRVSFSCCIRRDTLASCRETFPHQPAGAAVLQHVMASCTPARDLLRKARLLGAWLSAGPIRPGLRKSFDRGVFRAGNLVAEAHPIIADGISMAMQSAALLSGTLIAGKACELAPQALAALGRDHEALCRSRFALRIGLAGALAQMAQRPIAAKIIARAVEAVPKLLTWGAALSGKVSVHQPTA